MTNRTVFQSVITAFSGTVILTVAVIALLLNHLNHSEMNTGDPSGLIITEIISLNGGSGRSVNPDAVSGSDIHSEPPASETVKESTPNHTSAEKHTADVSDKAAAVKKTETENRTATKKTRHQQKTRRQESVSKKTASDKSAAEHNSTSPAKINNQTGSSTGTSGEKGKSIEASDSGASSSSTSGTAKNTAEANHYNKAYGILVNRARQLHTYPYQAVKRGIEGRGLLTVTINRKGLVVASKLAKSSNSPILDKAMISLGEKLIGFDTGITGMDLMVNIPLVYRLTR